MIVQAVNSYSIGKFNADFRKMNFPEIRYMRIGFCSGYSYEVFEGASSVAEDSISKLGRRLQVWGATRSPRLFSRSTQEQSQP